MDSYNPRPELLCLIQRQASLCDILFQTLVKPEGMADSHFFQSSLLHPFCQVRLADLAGSTHPQTVEKGADHQAGKLILLWDPSAHVARIHPA